MSDRPPTDPNNRDDEGEDDDDRSDSTDRFDDERGYRTDSWLSSLLGALDRLEEFSRSDHRRRSGPTGLDYDVSIRSGLSSLGGDQGRRDGRDDRHSRPQGVDRPPVSDRPGGSDRPRTKRRYSGSRDSHVSTRSYDDELLVTADISGVEPDDVTVGFDDDTLVIGTAGQALERVEVPWPDPAADAAVRNGVLTVSVRPDSDAESEGNET